MTLNNGELG